MKKKLSRLEKTAYHEAGHSVACCLLKIKFKHTTVKQKSDSYGHTLKYPYPKMFDDLEKQDSSGTRKRMEDYVMESLAGHISEEIFGGHKNWVGASEDYHEAVKLVSELLTDEPEEIEAYLKWIRIRTKNWLQRPLHKLALKNVANSLLQKENLKADEVRKIVKSVTTKI